MDDVHNGPIDADDEGKGLAVEAESGANMVDSESRADAQKDKPAAIGGVQTRINVGAVDARVGDGVADRVADRITGKALSEK